MRIKEGFILKENKGKLTVVGNGKQIPLTNISEHTDTTLFLWETLKKGDASKTDMLNGLLSNFKISTVLALGEINIFLSTMNENEIIED